MNNKLTLLCLSYNRPSFLKRTIEYWKDKDFLVLIADGSDKPLNDVFTSDKNISYFHQPISYKERMLESLKKIKTPYVCLICDDEFYLPSSLNKLINFLDKNENYVSTVGRAIGFRLLNNQICLNTQYPRFKDRDLSSQFPLKRLEKHFKKYTPSHYYAVCRKDVFIKSMKHAISFESDVFAMFEILFEYFVVASGKTKVLPILSWLRSHESMPTRDKEEGFSPEKMFSFWWVDSSEKSKFEKKIFCDYINKFSGNKFDENSVEKIFNLLVHDDLHYEKKISTASKKNFLLKCLILSYEKSPDFIKHIWQKYKTLISNLLIIRMLRRERVFIDCRSLAECFKKIKG